MAMVCSLYISNSSQNAGEISSFKKAKAEKR
jgi:hypothetical protein